MINVVLLIGGFVRCFGWRCHILYWHIDQIMLNFEKVGHIVVGALVSVSYGCFVIQLARQKVTYVCLGVYCILFFIYSLKAYSAFHFGPTQPNIHTTDLDLNLIFAFKLTQERRRELELALREARPSQKRELIKEYEDQHKKASFCDICQRVQPPRAYHCLRCDACIMGKQIHSRLVGFCIGQNNQIIYLTYLMASKILCFYAFISLTIIELGSDQLGKLPQAYQLGFVITIWVLAILFVLYLREFYLLLASIQSNKTICEANDPFLQNASFGRAKHSVTYWKMVKRLFWLMGESSSWRREMEDAEVEL